MANWTLITTQGNGSGGITNGHPKAGLYGGTFVYVGTLSGNKIYTVCSLFQPESDNSGAVWVEGTPDEVATGYTANSNVVPTCPSLEDTTLLHPFDITGTAGGGLFGYIKNSTDFNDFFSPSPQSFFGFNRRYSSTSTNYTLGTSNVLSSYKRDDTDDISTYDLYVGDAEGNYTGGLFISSVNGGTSTHLKSDQEIRLLAPKYSFRKTLTADGVTGNQTINRSVGTVNLAPGTSSIVVTNSQVTISSIIFATIQTNDATAVIKNVVAAEGSFTIRLTANCTGETKIGFIVTN